MGGNSRGGQKRGRTQRRHFRDGREDVWKKSRPDGATNAGWDPFVTENPMFEQYYKTQCIVAENEWDDFIAMLRKPLPAVFRINRSGPFAKEIREQIEDDFMESLKKDNQIDGEVVELVKPLPWYPEKLAWHLNFSRMQLRKNQTLARVHEFLKRENEIGSITRQEAVSMLPPLFLGVHPHHRVLDMCAAPGSKTFQLLEMLHSADKKGSLPEGLVVANDLDVQRCHLLIHQTKRMCSPNVIVTNHEAQHFPGLRKERGCGDGVTGSWQNASESNIDSTPMNRTEEEEKGLVFDRVLCDVPCSGDGTIRKAPDLWKKWNAGIGNGLHRLQVQIAMRGVALLKVGGRLVYSTCSLNPVENEAVVGEILRRCKGCMELIDVSNDLPQLKCRPGLRTWKVRDKGLWIASYQQLNKHRAGSIVPSMFPAGKGHGAQVEPEDAYRIMDVSDQIVSVGPFIKAVEGGLQIGNLESGGLEADEGKGEVTNLPLERCLRILPHDQDTGGFFIAVFQKISPLKVEHFTRENARKHNICTTVDAGEALASAEISICMREQTSRVLESHSQEPAADLDLDEDSSSKKLESQCEPKGVPTFAKDFCEVSNTPQERVENDAQEKEQNTVETNLKSDNCAGIDNGSIQKSSGRVQQQGNWKGVDPVLFLRDEAIIDSLVNFYGIKDTFPLYGHLVTRSEDISRLKRIYYVSQSVADVLKLNFRAGEQMKITSAGLKIFERQGGKEGFSPCAFRIASEGLAVLLPHLTKQIVYASKLDFKLLLSSRAVSFSAFQDENFASAVQALLPGCCIVILTDDENHREIQAVGPPTAIGCWRGRTNMSVLIPKAEAGQLLERLSLAEGDELLAIKADGDALGEQETIETMIEDGVTMTDDDLKDATLVSDDISEPQSPKNIEPGASEPQDLEGSEVVLCLDTLN